LCASQMERAQLADLAAQCGKNRAHLAGRATQLVEQQLGLETGLRNRERFAIKHAYVLVGLHRPCEKKRAKEDENERDRPQPEVTRKAGLEGDRSHTPQVTSTLRLAAARSISISGKARCPSVIGRSPLEPPPSLSRSRPACVCSAFSASTAATSL